MNRLKLILALLVLTVTGSEIADATSPRKAKAAKAKVEKPVDISSVVDSAIIMADDYAVACLEKPELKNARLNALRKFYERQPAAAQDSVTAHIFELAVLNLEQEKPERSAAFRSCFLSLAKETDKNLGPIYNLELTEARARMDTLAMNQYADKLEDYARRMDYDYDAEIAEARSYVHHVRTRLPLREALTGVWVSEDIAGFSNPTDPGLFTYNYRDSTNSEKEWLITTTPILMIRNSAHEVYKNIPNLASLDSIARATKVRDMDAIKSAGATHNIAGARYYRPLEAWELSGYGYDPLPLPIVSKIKSDLYSPAFTSDEKRHSRNFSLYEDDYAAYILWGDERLKRPDAETAAIVRQSVQGMRASVAGELSRSTVDFSTRLVGNMLSDLGGAIIGGIIDALMVSKEKIWSIEMTLVPVNPYELDAVICAHLVISRSDSPKPEVYNYYHTTKYYKWLPDDDVFFASPTYYDADSHYGNPISMHLLPKDIEKERKNFIKQSRKEFLAGKKETLNNLKKAYKDTPKDQSEEYNQRKENYENYKKYQPKFVFWFNRQMLEKLKQRADNYQESTNK